jgi:hypothetical protein
MAAGSTYTPIATYTASGSSGVITFSSISGSYTDLVLVSQYQVSADNYTDVTLNNDTGSNYSATYLSNSGGSAVSGRYTSQAKFPEMYGYTGANNGMAIWNFQNYSNSTTYKTALLREWYGVPDLTEARVLLWRATSPITIITLTRRTGNWSSGSTFTLYGIAAA